MLTHDPNALPQHQAQSQARVWAFIWYRLTPTEYLLSLNTDVRAHSGALAGKAR